MLRTSNKCQGFAAPNQQHDNNSELLQQTEKQSEQASNVWSEDEGDSKVVVADEREDESEALEVFSNAFLFLLFVARLNNRNVFYRSLMINSYKYNVHVRDCVNV
jgi:hypothetical protein